MSEVDISARLAAVRAELAGVPRRWSHDIAILAVTKGFDGEVLEAALDAGCDRIGENYAQELLSKRSIIDRTFFRSARCCTKWLPEYVRSVARRHRKR